MIMIRFEIQQQLKNGQWAKMNVSNRLHMLLNLLNETRRIVDHEEKKIYELNQKKFIQIVDMV